MSTHLATHAEDKRRQGLCQDNFRHAAAHRRAAEKSVKAHKPETQKQISILFLHIIISITQIAFFTSIERKFGHIKLGKRERHCRSEAPNCATCCNDRNTHSETSRNTLGIITNYSRIYSYYIGKFIPDHMPYCTASRFQFRSRTA